MTKQPPTLLKRLAASETVIAIFRAAVLAFLTVIVSGGAWVLNRIDETHTAVERLASALPPQVDHLRMMDQQHDVRIGSVERRVGDIEAYLRVGIRNKAEAEPIGRTPLGPP